jgi:hypothetical protein
MILFNVILINNVQELKVTRFSGNSTESKIRNERKGFIPIASTKPCTGISRFTSLIRSSKTPRKEKTRKTKINFPLLPDGNNVRFARGRRSYKRKLVRKLKNRY